MAMRYWRTWYFRVAYAVLLLPSLFVFAVPGAIFIDEGTGAVKAIGILASQTLLAFAMPWLGARAAAWDNAARKARNEQRRAEFPVILSGPAVREAV